MEHSTSTRALEARARRLLAKEGSALIKYRSDSRWYNQYGPYAIADANTNTLEAWGISDLDALITELVEAAASE